MTNLQKKLQRKNKETDWIRGYKAGQRRVAQRIMEIPLDSLADIVPLLAKLYKLQTDNSDTGENYF